MQSRTTRQFWRFFSDLPFDVQREAKRAILLFQSNPAHPGLQFKKLEGELAVMKKDRVVWYWIGSHSEYDRLV
jgi:hypothetical protein